MTYITPVVYHETIYSDVDLRQHIVNMEDHLLPRCKTIVHDKLYCSVQKTVCCDLDIPDVGISS